MITIKLCRDCQSRANCIYYQKNSFCQKNQLLEEEIFGYNKTQKKILFELITLEGFNINNNCNFAKMIRKEIKDIVEYFDELEEEKKECEENARLQKSENLAIEP